MVDYGPVSPDDTVLSDAQFQRDREEAARLARQVAQYDVSGNLVASGDPKPDGSVVWTATPAGIEQGLAPSSTRPPPTVNAMPARQHPGEPPPRSAQVAATRPGEPRPAVVPSYAPEAGLFGLGPIIGGILPNIPNPFGGDCAPADWTRAGPGATAAQLAAGDGNAREGYGQIQNPAANGGANYAYLEGGMWFVDYRGKITGCDDPVVVGAVSPLGTAAGGLPVGTQPGPITMPGECAAPGPIAPRQIVQMRCPPGFRLAKNRMCYDEDTLPRKWFLNDPKPAKISWSEWNHVTKAKAAVKKILKLGDTVEELTGAKATASARASAARARREVKQLTDGM